MFLPQHPPLMLEFHPLHPLRSLYTHHHPPQITPNFNGLGFCICLLDLSRLFFRGLLFQPLLRNPSLSPPHLLHRPITCDSSPPHQRKIDPFVDQVPTRPKRGYGLGEAGMWGFDGMFVMQMGVVVLSCVDVHSCWVREYEGIEAEKEASARKRSKRIEKVQEESMANAERISEIKAKEFDEKMKSKYGQWV